jgi:hypothetical protein
MRAVELVVLEQEIASRASTLPALRADARLGGIVCGAERAAE